MFHWSLFFRNKRFEIIFYFSFMFQSPWYEIFCLLFLTLNLREEFEWFDCWLEVVISNSNLWCSNWNSISSSLPFSCKRSTSKLKFSFVVICLPFYLDASLNFSNSLQYFKRIESKDNWKLDAYALLSNNKNY